MIKKNIQRLAVAGGAQGAASSRQLTGRASSYSSLFARMLQALHLQQPAASHLHVVEPLAEAATPLAEYEQHCASEQEAREFAAAMTRQGARAEVVYDPYDYSWSVEVYGPEHPPRHDA